MVRNPLSRGRTRVEPWSGAHSAKRSLGLAMVGYLCSKRGAMLGNTSSHGKNSVEPCSGTMQPKRSLGLTMVRYQYSRGGSPGRAMVKNNTQPQKSLGRAMVRFSCSKEKIEWPVVRYPRSHRRAWKCHGREPIQPKRSLGRVMVRYPCSRGRSPGLSIVKNPCSERGV